MIISCFIPFRTETHVETGIVDDRRRRTGIHYLLEILDIIIIHLLLVAIG
jgi:hypothetical protein